MPQAKAQPTEREISPDDISDEEVLEYIKQNNPEVYERLMALPPEDQQRAMAMMRSGGASAQGSQNTNREAVGDL